MVDIELGASDCAGVNLAEVSFVGSLRAGKARNLAFRMIERIRFWNLNLYEFNKLE
jgi:hypothetical protein